MQGGQAAPVTTNQTRIEERPSSPLIPYVYYNCYNVAAPLEYWTKGADVVPGDARPRVEQWS